MFETPCAIAATNRTEIAPCLHVRFCSCNSSATKIASSCRDKNRLCKRAFMLPHRENRYFVNFICKTKNIFCRARKGLGMRLAQQCYAGHASSGFLCKVAYDMTTGDKGKLFFLLGPLFCLSLLSKTMCSLWFGCCSIHTSSVKQAIGVHSVFPRFSSEARW